MRTLADRCERALELVRAMETDGISIGLVFAECALIAARDEETADETIRFARHADYCLQRADVDGDALRLSRDARQVLSLLVDGVTTGRVLIDTSAQARAEVSE